MGLTFQFFVKHSKILQFQVGNGGLADEPFLVFYCLEFICEGVVVGGVEVEGQDEYIN